MSRVYSPSSPQPSTSSLACLRRPPDCWVVHCRRRPTYPDQFRTILPVPVADRARPGRPGVVGLGPGAREWPMTDGAQVAAADWSALRRREGNLLTNT